MKIGILKTGSAPSQLAEAQGDYDARMRWLLGDEGFTYVTYDVEHGNLPAAVDEADGWIITGSRHGVYEEHAWIGPLESFIRDLEHARRPLVGICFGHQIIAKALGGRVQKASDGWIAGPQVYTLENGENFAANAWHQDQVIEKPPTAVPIGHSSGCEFAVLHYPGFALSVQPHPEFTAQYFRGLLDERGHVLPEDIRATVQQDSAVAFDDPYPVEMLREFMRHGSASLER